MKVNKPVFFISTGIIGFLVLLAVLMPDSLETSLIGLQQTVITNFGWFYILSVAIILVFCVYIALSSYGDIKLGPDHINPDFSYLSWFSMLFSAGMGIGLVFFGVAEPLMHYTRPPVGESGTLEAASQALSITFFHWGLHAWAIYAVVGLMLAYFSFRHHLPLTIRSSLYPILGDRIYGKIGNAVDIAAVISTLFGIATSLGFGVFQINSGLHYLFDIPFDNVVQFILIAIICFIAAISVATGLQVGIRRLSELNLIAVLLLLLFVFVSGPTVQLLQLFVQNIGAYLESIVSRTFNLYAYEQTGWIGGWTLFYWGWWIAWSPFVGMFIARISRGRTIREFILGVLFVPVGFTFIWMTFFGNTAILFDINPETFGILSKAVQQSTESAIFVLFEQLPFPLITSTLTIFVITLFFITSADSGALVIDTITAGGRKKSPLWQRIYWVIVCGLVAGVLLLIGGLKALQTATLLSALPFAIIILLSCYGLLRSLKTEKMKQLAQDISPSQWSSTLSWRKRLHALITHPQKEEVRTFLKNNVIPALENVEQELHKQDLTTEMRIEHDSVSLSVIYGEEADFYYSVYIKGYLMPSFAMADYTLEEEDEDTSKEDEKYYRAEVYLKEGSQHYDIMGYTQDEVIADVLAHYERHVHFLHLTR